MGGGKFCDGSIDRGARNIDGSIHGIAIAYRRHSDSISPPARIDFSGGLCVGVYLCVLVRSHKRAARNAEMCIPYWKMSDFSLLLFGLVSPVGLAGWFAS